MQFSENYIREYAYKIWESEGKPEGQAEKHWDMACKSLQETTGHHESGEVDHSDTFIPHQNDKKGKHAHHPHQQH